MSTPAIIMWAVVMLIGVPAGWRNPTAAALVLSWIFGEVVAMVTGNNLPVEYYLYPDLFVLAVIMIKPERCNLRPCRSILAQLKCILLERSLADRIIMLIFPAMWVIYTIQSPYYKWWALWTLAIIQFLAAGAEALCHSSIIRRHAEVTDRPSDNPDALLVAHHGGGKFG